MGNQKTYILVSIIAILGMLTYWNFSSTSAVGEQSIFGGTKNGLTKMQKDIVMKFRDGDIPGLVEYFDDEVSITVMDESDFYLKDEAEEILREFCQQYKAKKFYVKHHGSNRTRTSYYLIAELVTTSKEKYRVYISNNDDYLESVEITKPRDI